MMIVAAGSAMRLKPNVRPCNCQSGSLVRGGGQGEGRLARNAQTFYFPVCVVSGIFGPRGFGVSHSSTAAVGQPLLMHCADFGLFQRTISLRPAEPIGDPGGTATHASSLPRHTGSVRRS